MPDIKPECPRCGYDQSGAVAAWENLEPRQCPLGGVCSECELEFEWRVLLNPELRREIRMFEHAMRRKSRSFVRTWWAAARPWKLWRWIRMEHQVVPQRIAVLTIVGGLLVHLACLSAAAALSVVDEIIFRVGGAPSWWFRPKLQDKVVDELVDLFWPLGWPGKWDAAIRFGNIRLFHFARPAEFVALMTYVLTPFVFLLLPDTLRKCRVRSRHLWRVWAYGLIWMPVVISLTVLARKAALAIGSVFHDYGEMEMYVAQHEYWARLFLLLAWQFTWWLLAIVRYLRLPHAFGVAIAVIGIPALAMLIAALVLWGGVFHFPM